MNGAAVSRVVGEINSPGGSLFDALSIAEQLRRLVAEGIPVVPHVRGLAASGAAVVFAAGTKRFMSPGSMLMYHSLLYRTDDGYTWLPDGRRQLRDRERINEHLIALVSEWAGIARAEV